MFIDDIQVLVCPDTHSSLDYQGTNLEMRLEDGALICPETATAWAVERGIPRLYRDETITPLDKRYRALYDRLPRLHDPAVRWTLPLFQTGGTESDVRAEAIQRMHLQELRTNDGPRRVLEVGVGTGANLPLLRAANPDPRVQLWGVDLSAGMLAQAKARCTRKLAETRLLLADAHALPFPDHCFDRVLQVGGVNAFGDPTSALAEMTRVCRPGGRIVLVDEHLDPDRDHNPWHQLWFKAITALGGITDVPTAHLPPRARDVEVNHPTRFFYCLSFRV